MLRGISPDRQSISDELPVIHLKQLSPSPPIDQVLEEMLDLYFGGNQRGDDGARCHSLDISMKY